MLLGEYMHRIDSTIDITRLGAQVVSGIGFLGAGAILKDGFSVRGLTTAATLWCNAAIGILCSAGLLKEAITGCIFILFSNIFLKYLNYKISNNYNQKETYVFKIRCEQERENKIRNQITKATKNENIKLTNIEVKTLENGNSKIYATISSNLDFNYLIDKLMNTIASEKGILSVGWNKLDKLDDDTEDINEI
jgi:putative Mg2+ transporter-C (MgtC) family protein